MKLQVQLDTAGPVAPGATVNGHVVVTEGGGARTLTVRLSFVEQTADYKEVARVAGEARVAEGNLAEGFTAPFSLPLPADALPGVACPEGTVGWEVSAQVDRRGLDVHAQQRVDVQPG